MSFRLTLQPTSRTLLVLLLSGGLLGAGSCVPRPEPLTPSAVAPPPIAPEAPVVSPEPAAPAPPVVTGPPAPPSPPPAAPLLEAVPWELVEGWPGDDPGAALVAFRQSCRAIGNKPDWMQVCEEAGRIDPIDEAAVRSFFTCRFVPYRLSRPDGTRSGLITGYYVPDLVGSRAPSERFAWPIYGVPEDLLTIDLRSVYPDLANYRLRGRLVGNRVVPYWDRAAIDGEQSPLEGRELLWVEDPVELFFLHIQGSGRITFENGERVMVHFADQNGHPFRSIGKLLIERGEMTRDQMSMQNIRAWARSHPEEVRKLLAENPSYIFFTELVADHRPPPGALGVILTSGRSLAVDPRKIPLGAPVFLSTTWPSSRDQLQRLMVAQDTGGAIKGEVRADFFWGMGDAAGALAGRMKQQGQLWVLYPAPAQPPGAAVSSP